MIIDTVEHVVFLNEKPNCLRNVTFLKGQTYQFCHTVLYGINQTKMNKLLQNFLTLFLAGICYGKYLYFF